MPFQSRIPTNRDRRMSPGQESALRRAEAGQRLSDGQRGQLHAVAQYGRPEDALRASVALDSDKDRRTGRGRS